MSTDHRFQLTELDPAEIIVEERLVALREEHVLDLAEHIERSRYVQPILVVKLAEPVGHAAYRLIAGRHRTEACRLLSWPVPALVVEEQALETGEERLLEALENSGRLVLTHAQRVQHEQLILKHYEQQLGRPLNREERAARVADTAKRNGIKRRTAQTLIQRAESLSPQVLEAVKGSRLDNNKGLELLASMKDDEARLQRIEKERERAEREERQRPQQEAQRQAAGWILEILERGLGAAEIQQIAQILPLTTTKLLADALERAQGAPNEEAA
ncbi:ParB N-terminal domain-containing protein [Lamprobacter modestohalophilus]|uniref:ParB N-terminal domain-containing protein n=1 Tax=Lamprobacter modestohalophilus TaxID=1064514 RepID=UPI002ADEBAA6|nr:ParB N-terminal domain-containing protein [Lamprobacter modestohalophilus]MEA1050478.1 ParB N-terminal domain-containing protein [Lamprobacter modestohalophilus]